MALAQALRDGDVLRWNLTREPDAACRAEERASVRVQTSRVHLEDNCAAASAPDDRRGLCIGGQGDELSSRPADQPVATVRARGRGHGLILASVRLRVSFARAAS